MSRREGGAFLWKIHTRCVFTRRPAVLCGLCLVHKTHKTHKTVSWLGLIEGGEDSPAPKNLNSTDTHKVKSAWSLLVWRAKYTSGYDVSREGCGWSGLLVAGILARQRPEKICD